MRKKFYLSSYFYVYYVSVLPQYPEILRLILRSTRKFARLTYTKITNKYIGYLQVPFCIHTLRQVVKEMPLYFGVMDSWLSNIALRQILLDVGTSGETIKQGLPALDFIVLNRIARLEGRPTEEEFK